ncbi:hypothetical protein PVK06_020998 [Gossypium arboreum]|uniref:Reverse transcriptase zinc-binding domain-containing protein n=1 Tax=Gossypium arboreum TaxID=29729 RepID=A0ABR0PPA0_GOSAR|nr:hypothetical protein PVK06_020998 [Gossypium arboreum]
MMCPRYEEGVETVNHVFKSCPFAKEVLGLVDFPRILSNSIQNMFEWLTWVFNNCPVLQRVSFCCGLWVLWTARNKFMHEHSTRSVVDISRFIQGYIKEIEGVKEKRFSRKELRDHLDCQQNDDELFKLVGQDLEEQKIAFGLAE